MLSIKGWQWSLGWTMLLGQEAVQYVIISRPQLSGPRACSFESINLDFRLENDLDLESIVDERLLV